MSLNYVFKKKSSYYICLGCGQIFHGDICRFNCPCHYFVTNKYLLVTSEQGNAARRIKDPKKRVKWIIAGGPVSRHAVKGSRKWFPVL